MEQVLRKEEREGSAGLDLFGKKKGKGWKKNKLVTGSVLFLLITVVLHGDILHLKKLKKPI